MKAALYTSNKPLFVPSCIVSLLLIRACQQYLIFFLNMKNPIGSATPKWWILMDSPKSPYDHDSRSFGLIAAKSEVSGYSIGISFSITYSFAFSIERSFKIWVQWLTIFFTNLHCWPKIVVGAPLIFLKWPFVLLYVQSFFLILATNLCWFFHNSKWWRHCILGLPLLSFLPT